MLKRNMLSSPEKTWRKPKGTLGSEGSQSEKGYTLYDFNHVTFLRRQNSAESKKISGCQGLGEREGYAGRVQRVFRAIKLLFMIPQW